MKQKSIETISRSSCSDLSINKYIAKKSLSHKRKNLFKILPNEVHQVYNREKIY